MGDHMIQSSFCHSDTDHHLLNDLSLIHLLRAQVSGFKLGIIMNKRKTHRTVLAVRGKGSNWPMGWRVTNSCQDAARKFK